MKFKSALCEFAPVLLALFSTLNGPVATAYAQGSAFTYQGQIHANGSPASGTYNLAFTLYTNSAGGNIVAGSVTNSAVLVTNGLFTTLIDFGFSSWNGESNWLQIAVETNGGTGFTRLSPRQQLTPAPYAIFAGTANTATTASSANSVAATNITGTLLLAALPAAVITNNASSANIGTMTSTNFIGNGAGLTNLSVALSELPAGVITNNAPSANIGKITSTNFTGNGAGLTNLSVSLSGLPLAVITNNGASLTLGPGNEIAPLTLPPSVPTSATGSISTGTNPNCIAVGGRYAYVVNYGVNSLQIFDVSNPSNPVSVGSAGTGSNPSSVAVAGRYAYVVNSASATLQIFDVSNPSSPLSVGTTNTGSAPNSIAVAGRYAYVVNSGSGTLQIFDVGTPSNPVSVGSASTGSNPLSVAVAGRYAYVASSSSGGLQIFDVSNPSSPSLVSSTTASGPQSVAVSGRYAYVVYSSGGLNIFDVSNPSTITQVSSIGTLSTPVCVVVSGRYAYVAASGNNSLQIFDVSNPSTPSLVGSIGTGSAPNSVAVSGRYAYVVNRANEVLQIFDLGGAYVQQLEAGTIETGGLQSRDTLTVGNGLDVRGGLTVSASARISGGLSVNNGTIVATNFTGNGAGLTNLNASQLAAGVVPLSLLPGFQGPNYQTSSGGQANSNGAPFATIGGGEFNTNSGDAGTIGGGSGNVVSNSYATVPGGEQNVAGGQASLAAGQMARALYNGDFVWADFENTPFSSTASNQFLIRAQGGVGINTNNPGGASLYVQGNRTNGAPGSMAWFENTSTAANASPALRAVVDGGHTPDGALSVAALVSATAPNSIIAEFANSGGLAVVITNNGTIYSQGVALVSDRNAKENFTPLDARAVLAKVAALPVTQWNYKDESRDTRHIGPVAQEFHAAFGLNGEDETHISVVDEAGVALAAIQGLQRRLDEQAEELKRKDQQILSVQRRNQLLEKHNQALEERLKRVERLVGGKE